VSAAWSLDNSGVNGTLIGKGIVIRTTVGSTTNGGLIFTSFPVYQARLSGPNMGRAAFGQNVASVGKPGGNFLLTQGVLNLPSTDGYFAFTTPGGINGWFRWQTDANSLAIIEDYYNDTPNGAIKVGQTSSPSAAVPFDFNPLQGAALGVPIFIGLRQLKRRKAKLNTMVSVKGKEKIHPLALLGMGAAGVLKWRAQKDKDAA